MLYDVQQQRRIRNISDGNFHSVSTSNKAEKFRHRRLSCGIENSRQIQHQQFKREENELRKTLDRLNKDKLRNSHINTNVEQDGTSSHRYLPRPPSSKKSQFKPSNRRYSCPAAHTTNVPTINVLTSPPHHTNNNLINDTKENDTFSLNIDASCSAQSSIEELELHRTDSVIHVEDFGKQVTATPSKFRQRRKSCDPSMIYPEQYLKNIDNIQNEEPNIPKLSPQRRKSCNPSMMCLPESFVNNENWNDQPMKQKIAQRRQSTLALDADELLKKHGGGSSIGLNHGRRASAIVIEEITPFYLEKKFTKNDADTRPSNYRRNRRNALNVDDVDEIDRFADQYQHSADLNTISFKHSSSSQSRNGDYSCPSSPRLPSISNHGLMTSKQRLNEDTNRKSSFWNQQIRKASEEKGSFFDDQIKIDSLNDIPDGSQLDFNDDGTVFPAYTSASDYTLEDFLALRKCRYLRLSKMNWESLKSQSANQMSLDS